LNTLPLSAPSLDPARPAAGRRCDSHDACQNRKENFHVINVASAPRTSSATSPMDRRNFYTPPSDTTLGRGALDISRTENGYVVELVVAGFKPEEIEITHKENVLSVSAKNERRTFTRSLMLPDEIDADTIEARAEHGLLTLTLRRRAEVEPKRISISTN
jgi:HSP20 family molecular chaperone IbpA